MLSRTPTTKWTLGSRAFWLRQMRQWHWISAAICLIGMLLFAITGITLNHASQIESKPQVTARTAQVPDDLLRAGEGREGRGEAAAAARRCGHGSPQALGVQVGEPRRRMVAGDLRLAAASGRRRVARDRSRHRRSALRAAPIAAGSPSSTTCTRAGIPGPRGRGFIDVFAVACIVFCLTGLVLLQLLAGQRPSTWPLVGARAGDPAAARDLLHSLR